MYIPSNMAMPSLASAQDFIHQFSFGVIISEGLEATHLPFLLKVDEGKSGTLYGHFAKANPHWNDLLGKRALIIFSGPHSYISPLWYKNTPAVPTWNYAAVHCYGEMNLLDVAATQQMLEETIKKHDPELLNQNTVMPDEFRDRLTTAIIGFKVEIDKIEAKLKIGQNRKIEDQQSVLENLKKFNNPESAIFADFMENHLQNMPV